ncbi:MAG: alpha/beta fold hydrolase [Steroidobacteraceae bacterium]
MLEKIGDTVGKHSKSSAAPVVIRTRRAYFDCQFGQLHVRTAFPSSGGFDEQVTLFCLHPSDGSGRRFDRLLPAMAQDRSVYAPDLPGFGESDPAPSFASSDAARAMSDLVTDLRLRRIDVLGVGFGAAVALELAVARPDLVRRLVLAAVPPMDQKPAAAQQALVLEGADELLGASPAATAIHIRAFLRG